MIFRNIRDRIPTRAVIWVMLFTSTFFLYVMRINLSIVILDMVEPSKNVNGSVRVAAECAAENAVHLNMTSSPVPVLNVTDRFRWNSKLQALILGAYFWGFVVAAIPAAALAEHFGPTRSLAASFVASGVLTMLGPLAAVWHPVALIVTRFFIGVFAGLVYPGMHCLISRWAPAHEKGRFMAALLGGSLGTVATWPALGAIVGAFGWRWGFYACGGAVLLWTALWLLLVADSPAAHPRIDDRERSYIAESVAASVNAKKKLLPPYKSIFLSVPVWGLIVLHFGNLWGLFFLMTAGPTFMSTVLGFNLGHTGILAALPYLARFFFGCIFSSLGDLLLVKKWMSKVAIRKCFVLFSHILPGILLFVQTTVGCRVAWTIPLITLSLGSNGASTITNLQNSQDLAPNFAGSIYGIINCIGSVTGFITPLIVGYLTAERNGIDEWHTIFYIGASVYILCGVVFWLIGSADVQPWNNQEDKNEKQPAGIENIAFEGTEEGAGK